MIKHFTRNLAGRDLIVGDVHGNFSKLQASLDAIVFDPARDRLFSVGDLVDRGPESEQALEWLAKPWFHAICGNHEQMAIDAAAGLFDRGMYLSNGGAWFMALPKPHQNWIAEQFGKLPMAIELETAAGLVGIVHADCPTESWAQLHEALSGDSATAYENMCMWSRDRIASGFHGSVEGVVAVVVGHTPVERWTTLGNVIYIDTGGWLPPHHGNHDFTLLDAATLRPVEMPRRQVEWS